LKTGNASVIVENARKFLSLVKEARQKLTKK
jgi:hypothetical protein